MNTGTPFQKESLESIVQRSMLNVQLWGVIHEASLEGARKSSPEDWAKDFHTARTAGWKVAEFALDNKFVK